MKALDDALIITALTHFEQAPSPLSSMLWFPLGGAASRIAPDATAYPHRQGIHMGIYSLWPDTAENEANVAWARQGFEAIRPFSMGGVYVNELGLDESDERIRGAYGVNYERLAELKRQYDPSNLFRLNANILPAGT